MTQIVPVEMKARYLNFPGGIITVRLLSFILVYDTKNAIGFLDGDDECCYGVLYQLYEHVRLD